MKLPDQAILPFGKFIQAVRTQYAVETYNLLCRVCVCTVIRRRFTLH